MIPGAYFWLLLIFIKEFLGFTQNNYQYLVDNKMQSNTRPQTRTQPNILDRPMQKSMMQLNSRSPNNNHQQGIHLPDNSPTTLLKKSYLASTDNLSSENSSLSSPPNFSFSLKAYQHQPGPREQKISQEPGGQSSALKQKCWAGLRWDGKQEGNPEELLRFGCKGGDTSSMDKKGSNALKEQLVKEIMAYFKDQYLPSVIKLVKKEVIEEVNNLRADLQNFKQEARNAFKQQEKELFQLSIQQNQLPPTLHDPSPSKSGNYKPEDINELQTHFFLLENKIAQIEKQLSLTFKEHKQNLQRLQAKLSDNRQLSKSVFKSSLPPLLLQYKQLLIVQREVKLHQEILNKTVYYVDRQGYLLDHDNYYLLDGKGEQIKLQDQHLRLLAFQKVIDS